VARHQDDAVRERVCRAESLKRREALGNQRGIAESREALARIASGPKEPARNERLP